MRGLTAHFGFLGGLLALLGLVPLAPAAGPDPTRPAIEKGLRRIEQGAANYITKRTCFSCHHQALSILSMSSARRRGFAVAENKLRRQIDFTLAAFKDKDKIRKGKGVEGASTQAVYALFALEGAEHSADDTTAALVQYLLVRQRRDGAWPALARRPPMEGSLFTNAALALRELRKYGLPPHNKGAEALRAKVEKAMRKGWGWLRDHEPQTTEDKVFSLRGLVAAGAPREGITAARDRLLKEQHKDGSWTQLPERAGDAYATGTVLMALRDAGMPTTDPAYQKGVKYLLGTQQKDGSWLVNTRTRPFQVFFDNGDPGGKSQFVSFASTCWAVRALLEQFPLQPAKK
jgi:N-acyl-D-amino-acid deacylase